MASRLKTKVDATGPTVSAGFVRALHDFAVRKGADGADLLARAGVTPGDLRDADNRLPFASYVAMIRGAAALTGDPAFALHFGERSNLGEYSVVGLIADASKTMGHALVQLNRYGRLIMEVDTGSDERFHVERTNGEAWFIDNRRDPNSVPEITESTFARIASHSRLFGTDDKPFVKGIHVTHPEPVYRAEYERIFRGPVVFNSDRNALLIDDDWTTYQVARSTTGYAFGILSDRAKALLAKLETARTTRGRVESLLIPILHTGEPNIERIAKKMAMSRKTLYRKLKAEGVTFETVLDDLRHRMAMHYLDGKKVSVNETAYLVGFSDASTFSRAFRRWRGVSPRKRGGH